MPHFHRERHKFRCSLLHLNVLVVKFINMILDIDIKKFTSSFKFAFEGIKIILKEEQNFKIMLFIAVLVIIAMFIFNISLIEKAILFLTVFLVLAVELLNSVIEGILTLFHRPEIDLQIKKLKDILAGISLSVCFGAVIIGILILINNLYRFCSF